MAGNMLRQVSSAFKSRCSSVRFISHSRTSFKIDKHRQYYFVLPEIPPDTAETNSIMRIKDPPDFQSISPNDVVTGCAKIAIEYETQLGKLMESLEDLNSPKNFSTVLEPIEEIAVPLSCAEATAQIQWVATGGEGYKEAFERVDKQIDRCRRERWVSEPLYNAVKEVKADSINLTEFQDNLADMYLLESRMFGIEIATPQQDKFNDLLRMVSKNRFHFRFNVSKCIELFKHVIIHKDDVRSLPDWYKKTLAQDKVHPNQGPWILTLQDSVYQPFMEYCDNSDLRYNAWRSKQNIASWEYNDPTMQLSNHEILGKIRRDLQDVSKMLGYENYSELSLSMKMAGSIENVMNLIQSCRLNFRDESHEDIIQLQEFATSRGFNEHLELWDLPFWKRRQKEDILGCTTGELSEYFPLPSVLNGLFELCSKLFGIRIKDCTGDVPTWAESVSFYRVYDEAGDEISSFYLDPYTLPGKLDFMCSAKGRDYSPLYNIQATTYMSLNLSPPVLNRPALLHLDEVEKLFATFGNALQQILTRVPYSDMSGQKNIQTDSVKVCSLFLSKWLYQTDVLKSVSCHWETQKQLSDHLIASIQKSEKTLKAHDMMRMLYFSAYDLELHVSKEYFYPLLSKVWPEYNVFQLDEDDVHPCSMTGMFCDYSASYYSILWSNMLAADIFSAFQEAGMDNKDKITVLGRRFRDTYLALGGGVPASEVFRRFRGRDPSFDALFNINK